MRKPRFETARFHVKTGPQSLFERVRFKMGEPRQLRVDPGHARDRAEQREAPIEKLCAFDPKGWTLMTAEVRTDKGKFVSTAWSVMIDGRNWWVVIGWDGALKTVIDADRPKLGLGSDIVVAGPLYEMVAGVNKELMDAERASLEAAPAPASAAETTE